MFFFAILIVSCQREEQSMVETGIEPKSSIIEPSVRLGAQLQNAYSLQNMRAAYIQMYGTINVNRVRATHLYIRVHPTDTT